MLKFVAIGHHPSPQTLKVWHEEHTEERLPAGDNQDIMFSAGFEVYEENHFACMNMVLTTKRLVQFAPEDGVYVEMIHNDDTAGTNWHGFPVMLSGLSDAGRHFHIMVVAICTKKNQRAYEFIARVLLRLRPTLMFRFSMSDAAAAIFNGFSIVYPNLGQFMCHMHSFIKNAMKVNLFLCLCTPLCVYS